MTQSNAIEVHKPQNIFHKKIDIKLKSLLLTVAQGTINCAFLKWDDLAENGVQLLDSLGLKDTPEERAGLLIIRALTAAIKNLLDSNIILFNNTQPDNPKELFKSLSNRLNNATIFIDDNFFTYPKNSPLIEQVKTVFLEWLTPFLENSAEDVTQEDLDETTLAAAVKTDSLDPYLQGLGIGEALRKARIAAIAAIKPTY